MVVVCWELLEQQQAKQQNLRTWRRLFPNPFNSAPPTKGISSTLISPSTVSPNRLLPNSIIPVKQIFLQAMPVPMHFHWQASVSPSSFLRKQILQLFPTTLPIR